VTNGIKSGEGALPTRANRQAATPPAPHPESAITTAEIPRISAPVAQFPRGDGWHPEIERRLPAPWGLQLAVWALFALFVLGLVGLAVEHFHPGWISGWRNTIPTGQTSANTSSTSPGAGSTTLPTSKLGKLVLIAATKSSATYSVPTSSGFTLVVSTNIPCYTLVKSPPTESGYAFAATITAKQSPEVINLTGPASVSLGASASALTIKVGSVEIGTITPPQALLTYIFTPTHH
jgi:hypothetical protein